MDIDERQLRSLVRSASNMAGPYPYAGASWDALDRYNAYEEPGFKLTPEDKALTQLYAGLAVLSRDMHGYFAGAPDPTARAFEEVIRVVSAEERARYGQKAFPFDDETFPFKDELARFPRELTAEAARGKPALKPLADPRIRHEWTVKSGKRIFTTFLRTLTDRYPEVRRSVCAPDGFYAQFLKDQSDEVTLVKDVCKVLLAAALGAGTIWYPFAVYIATLMVKRGLKSYCAA